MRFGLTSIAVFAMLTIQAVRSNPDQALAAVGYITLIFVAVLEITPIGRKERQLSLFDD